MTQAIVGILTLLVAGFGVFAAPSAAQPTTATVSDCSPSPEALKTLALDLSSKNQDVNAFIIALDAAVGADTAAMTQQMIGSATIIRASDPLTISLRMPYDTYRQGLIQAARMRDPLDTVPVPGGVVVFVAPSQIDAPDIVKVIVERDGKVITPVSNDLAPKLFETRLGAKQMIHAGAVRFQCSAFAPGANVTVTAIPQSGFNFVKTWTSAELSRMK